MPRIADGRPGFGPKPWKWRRFLQIPIHPLRQGEPLGVINTPKGLFGNWFGSFYRPVRFFLSRRLRILSLFCWVLTSINNSAPLQLVLVHNLRITVPWTSRSPGAGGAVVGAGGIPPSGDSLSCPLGFGYISYRPRSSLPGMLLSKGQQRMPCLGLPGTIILLVSTAYLDSGFALHWLASPRKLCPSMEWQPHCPQYNTSLSHLA